ncbi:Hint domain-containing protein, partial [Acetobacter sacchari]
VHIQSLNHIRPIFQTGSDDVVFNLTENVTISEEVASFSNYIQAKTVTVSGSYNLTLDVYYVVSSSGGTSFYSGGYYYIGTMDIGSGSSVTIGSALAATSVANINVISGSGTLNLQYTATLNSYDIGSSVVIHVDDTANVLNVPSPVTNKITNFNENTVLKFISAPTGGSVEWTENSDGSYTLAENNDGVITTLATDIVFATGVSPSDIVWDADDAQTTCFLTDSQISTPSGYRPIQHIAVNDDVIVYSNGMQKAVSVKWIGTGRVRVNGSLPDDRAGYPVRILENAISEGVPFKDMLVTAEHCLFFDGKFVPARMLVNGGSIFYDTTITSYDYYHIETETHSVIMADGMLTESYLDTGNRRSFTQLGNVVSISGRRNLTWDDAAAPLTVCREFVEPLFRQIEARAVEGARLRRTKPGSLTCEHGLHLITDSGVTLHPLREINEQVMFMIPAGVESVRVVSNSSRPSDVIGPFVDDRRTLGVLVGGITLSEGKKTTALTSYLEDVDLAGWSSVENSTTRWTGGNALLPLGSRPADGLALMTIQIHAAGPYLLRESPLDTNALQA